MLGWWAAAIAAATFIALMVWFRAERAAQEPPARPRS
jgi:hypothetical protein